MICIGQKWWEIGSRSVPRLGKRQFGVSRVPPCVERREKEGGPFFAPFPLVQCVPTRFYLIFSKENACELRLLRISKSHLFYYDEKHGHKINCDGNQDKKIP